MNKKTWKKVWFQFNIWCEVNDIIDQMMATSISWNTQKKAIQALVDDNEKTWAISWDFVWREFNKWHKKIYWAASWPKQKLKIQKLADFYKSK